MNRPVDPNEPISAAKVARRFFGRSPAWFSVHRSELEAKGFPQPIPLSGTYSPTAIQAWIDGKPVQAPNPRLTLEGLAGEWEKSA